MARLARAGLRWSGRPSARPTARGWQALVAGLVVLVVARLIGTTQFHQLAYAFLALLLASFVLGFAGSRGLRFSRKLPPESRLSAGEPARVDLLVSNDSPLGSPAIEVTDRLPDERAFEAPPLGSRGGAVVEVPVVFGRRGIYEFGPAEVRSADPFGLLRFRRRFGEKDEVVVYPRVHHLPGFPLRGGDAEAGSRGHVGRRGDEFSGLREYRRGDELRHVHWKSVARTGELYVKEFALHAPRRYAVALDLRRQGLRTPEAEVEDAVSAAASVLAHLREEGLPSRLICSNHGEDSTSFASDDASYWDAMRLLATVRADGGKEVSSLLHGEGEGLGEGVVVVARTSDDALAPRVRKLRTSGLSVVVVLQHRDSYTSATGARAREREAAFSGEAGRLEAAGATVLVLDAEIGVPGLAGARKRPAGGATGGNTGGSAGRARGRAGGRRRGAV